MLSWPREAIERESDERPTHLPDQRIRGRHGYSNTDDREMTATQRPASGVFLARPSTASLLDPPVITFKNHAPPMLKPSSLILMIVGLTLTGCTQVRPPATPGIEPNVTTSTTSVQRPSATVYESRPPAPPESTTPRAPAVESRALPRESLPPEPVHEKPVPGYSSSPYGVDPIPSLPAASEPTDPVLPEPSTAVTTPEPSPEAPTDPMATPPPESPAFTPPPEPKLFAQSAPPAVLALQTDIESNIKSGSYPDAAGSLERAIRIQPKNPELWHVLAEVRLKQNQPGLAEDLAKKSNLLAKNNAELIRSNWNLIAEARRLKGDTTGVMEALDKARW